MLADMVDLSNQHQRYLHAATREQKANDGPPGTVTSRPAYIAL
jgi:hypothetical protein